MHRSGLGRQLGALDQADQRHQHGSSDQPSANRVGERHQRALHSALDEEEVSSCKRELPDQ